MTLLWLGLAFAQEAPQEFPPQVADVTLEGVHYRGILIDEGTYAELGTLRTLKIEYGAKLETWEEWKEKNDVDFRLAIESVEALSKKQLQDQRDFYDDALKKEQRKDWFQRQAFPLGVGVGVALTTITFLGGTYFYGRVLRASLD